METHGIFGNERVMQFLIVMKSIAEQCFRQLHAVAQERKSDKAIAEESYRVGLRYISSWNDSIMEQEATHAIATYPDIVSNYKYTLIHYIKLTHRDKRAQVQLSVPPFKKFLHWFLVRIASSSQLQSPEWITAALFNEKDVFYREMLRQTIAADCLPQNLHFTTTEPQQQHSQDVFPQDSISNVPRASSVVDLTSTERRGPMQQLTPSLLHMHTEYPSSVGQPSAARSSSAASSVSGASSASSSSSAAPSTTAVEGPAAAAAAPAAAVAVPPMLPAAVPPVMAPVAAPPPMPAGMAAAPAAAMLLAPPPQTAAAGMPLAGFPLHAAAAVHGAPLNPNQTH